MSIFSKLKKKDKPSESALELNQEGLPNDALTCGENSQSSFSRRNEDTNTGDEGPRGRRHNDKTHPIINKLLSGQSMETILFSLTDDLKNLFDCDAVSIYAMTGTRGRFTHVISESKGWMKFV
ncbi:MAG: hypothetical protein HOL15_10960 [Nitrospinaceae bacterium]|nr:hypothetical protein [Nitrospinaceae bacterium]